MEQNLLQNETKVENETPLEMILASEIQKAQRYKITPLARFVHHCFTRDTRETNYDASALSLDQAI